MSRREILTFVDAVLAGDALSDDVDDWVDAWHDAPEESPISDLRLHEYLGLTESEYGTWVMHPESLRFVLLARHQRTTVKQVLKATKMSGVAARSEDAGEASALLAHLEQQGHIQRAQRQF